MTSQGRSACFDCLDEAQVHVEKASAALGRAQRIARDTALHDFIAGAGSVLRSSMCIMAPISNQVLQYRRRREVSQ